MPLPPPETTDCLRTRLDALRAELADFAYALERQGRLDAADAVMQVDARVRELASGEPSEGAPGSFSPMTTTTEINYPRVVSHAEWLKARLALLEREKEHTRERDRINQARRELPMVRVEQDYLFAGPDGPRSLADLFAGRRQLIVYHFMWHWEKGRPLDEPCRGCAGWVDQLSRGIFNGLHSRNTSLVLVSRAPLDKIQPFKQRMGWTVPWYSSEGNSFNYDYGVTIDASVAPVVYNYRTPAEHEKAGTSYYLQNPDQPFDLPGMSCFLRKEDGVYHTYSSYGRGGESTGGAYYFLDLTALGRQEDWEEPKGRAAGKGLPPRPDLNPFPDEYVT